VRRRWYDFTRRNDETLNRLSGDKRATAVDVCALMITLFCRVRKIATCASVGGVMAFWAVKHGEHLIYVFNASFYHFTLHNK
jgi:hypothetical protein